VRNEPTFHVTVPIRCFYLVESSRSSEPCGSPAEFVLEAPGRRPEYFCSSHQPKGARAIQFPTQINRVNVVVEIVLVGTSWEPGDAKNEALDRISAALRGVGGVVSLHSALCMVGRYLPPVPESAPNASPNGRRVEA
jgi:hypothetical protein